MTFDEIQRLRHNNYYDILVLLTTLFAVCLLGTFYRTRERQSTELSKRMRTSSPSPISGGNGQAERSQALTGTSSVARYVDDDVNFLRDLREINRVERQEIDRDNNTPIDARIHYSTSSCNGSLHVTIRINDHNMSTGIRPNHFLSLQLDSSMNIILTPSSRAPKSFTAECR